MWKEQLPEKCPTEKAVNLEYDVYRVTKTDTPCDEDFIVHSKLYPNNPRYQKLCQAYAISFFNNIENANKAIRQSIERGSKIGHYIAKYKLLKEYGKSDLNKSTGHINTWFYSNSNFKSADTLGVTEYDQN